MRIMGTVPREDVHWGQCFEEFYGPEYCKNLKKDLEKLKDEFYDGNAQRFQREWVVPTANLLRRLRHMGFPVRTRDFIIIHLYNPVDSMFAGEMHFQVGRKAPGTLTLKFTKQNSNGTFVIQPKTLSNADEMKLQEDPLDFLDKVRQEMGDSSPAHANLLRTLVLITESCKLQRQCAKVVFSKLKENAVTTPMNNHFQDIPAAPFTAASIPFNNGTGQWPMAGVNPQEVNSMRPDGSFPFPLSFCVKNYVNCGSKPEMGPQNLVRSGIGHHRMQTGPQTAGVAYRQTRSSTWHSEPEENDETMSPQSFTENNWPRLPPDSLEDVQRRMSDTHLWEATKVGGGLAQKLPSNNNLMFGQPFKQYGPNITEANVWTGGEVRTSLTDEYTSETQGLGPAGQTRRLSEPRTSATEEYCQDSPNAVPTVIPQMERRDSAAERTSLTEEYAGEEASTDANATSHQLKTKIDQSRNVSPRTSVVNDYAAGQQNALRGGTNQPTGYAFMQRQSVTALPQELQGNFQGMLLQPDFSDGRRTSSLDAYVGNCPAGLTVSSQDPRARSEGNLAVSSRTSTVDQYFQNQNPALRYYWQVPAGNGKMTNGQVQCGYVQDMTGVPLKGGNYSEMYRNPPPVNENRNGMPPEPEVSPGSLDSWMSHVGSASLMVQQDRLRANSVGNGYRRADEEDISLLSHTSYPSWGSHPAVHMHPNGGLLPMAIEEINNDSKNWQKYAPQNSLN